MDITELRLIIRDLEHQDLHNILTSGLSERTQGGLHAICTNYLGAEKETREIMKLEIPRKVASILTYYVSRMATVAMQQQDKAAIDLGLAAFDLSNVIHIDPREAFGPISRLAFAATQCGVDLPNRATAVIRHISPNLKQMLENPSVPRVLRNEQGKPIFANPWAKRSVEDAL